MLLASIGARTRSLSAFLLWVRICPVNTFAMAPGIEKIIQYRLTLSCATGQLNQAELSTRIDKFIVTSSGDIEHAHNKLIAGIFGNVTRDMPDHGLAPFVSANETPTAGAGNKPVSGDAAEQRLKQEVMQLPSRDRRRIKDLASNEVIRPDAPMQNLGSCANCNIAV